MIWFKDYRLDDLKSFRNTNMTAHLGFEFTEVGPDFLKGRLPVDNRTTQPFGILHGGASCVLAESLGSVASWMTIDPDKYRAVGIEINANHLRAVSRGVITVEARPLHSGRTMSVWKIDITNDRDKLICTSRLTMLIQKRVAYRPE